MLVSTKRGFKLKYFLRKPIPNSSFILVNYLFEDNTGFFIHGEKLVENKSSLGRMINNVLQDINILI
ncbi:hypothetical protein MYP_4677 [Sporocytophaga myxococcoides]|uniref:Uncharacterized protein n=1 Tax=Sporocytophaga myxococcoides TaxID=153721 RepID=A0A098LM76_9BACT|nr:hypothetical protein MYP_4677 [Sporocytophaga myxococcoides]